MLDLGSTVYGRTLIVDSHTRLSESAWALLESLYERKGFTVAQGQKWYAVGVPAPAARAWAEHGWTPENVAELSIVLQRKPSDVPHDPDCPNWAWHAVSAVDPVTGQRPDPNAVILLCRAGVGLAEAQPVARLMTTHHGLTEGLRTMAALRAL